jgi:hypothetical protein
MAFEGELVKMANGRWARFQSCRLSSAPGSILVAVELDERLQRLLEETTATVEEPAEEGGRPAVRLEQGEGGELSVVVPGGGRITLH